MTNAEIIAQLKATKEKMIADGTFAMQSRMTDQGDSITWRKLSEIDDQIDYYEQLESQTSTKRIGRIKFYG